MPGVGGALELDRGVRREDIQVLSSRDQVVALFAALGYQTDSRLAQSPANLGITADWLVRQITHLERLADQEGLLQVYLIELSSVTLAATRGIASALRNRAGNYLLVLTHDYERIDFVLVERIAPRAEAGQGFGQKQVSVRPRILTVNRRDPTKVDLRVLRRLSYTESDPIAQYDKLKSAFDIADWSEEHFNNRALFADYYLRERLPEDPVWGEDPKPVFRRFRELYDRGASRWAGKAEQELRRNLFDPALHALGFDLETVKAAPGDGLEPDYRLRTRDGSLAAVCLAYMWGRFLDGKDERRDPTRADENPGAVVVSLLERGDAPFAIVTNGKHWRLYAAKTHSRATNYYEIDLEETLALDDPNGDAFRYFWLLFRRQALEPREVIVDGQTARTTFIDQLLRESEQYAKRLGERLKDRVFEAIFPHFAEGFIANIRAAQAQHAAPLQQADLDAVFHGTLTFLYRLLFLLYAEARDLLPVKEVRGYFETSLTKLKQEMAKAAGDVSDQSGERLRKTYSTSSFQLYDRLTQLFRVIDRGDADRNVPVYNGGLFLTEVDSTDTSAEAENARFLLANKIPDRYLALGLDLLARDDDEKTYKRVFIDYKSLGVRQLGSIYEGLLEFRLRIAPEKMAVCKGKKTEEIVPYAEAKNEKRRILTSGRGKDAAERTLAKGAVYLENDKRERKATGSYYTPDYIVQYIVANTVGPVLSERMDGVRGQLREAQKALRRARQLAEERQRRYGKPEDPERAVSDRHRDVIDGLFGIKVLDPAMGSGHFLVEAVDFITDRMLDFLNGFPWNPVVHQLRETRETILRELDEQGVSIDAAKLTDVNLLKRHVLKRCIYGVDINPMAVELAKVSLWLDSFTLGAPLSFLDHHLKCGNSLIGVGVEEVRHAIEGKGLESDVHDVRSQVSLFGSRFAGLMLATDLMRHVGELSDVTAAQVKESRAEFKRASDQLAPFKRILDVYTSQWFGNGGNARKAKRGTIAEPAAIAFLKSGSAEPFIQRGEDILERNGRVAAQHAAPLPAPARQLVETVLRTTDEKRFFHWELEFPEVFYGPQPGTTQKIERSPDAGFDAVVANPPYAGFHGFEEIKPYLVDRFGTCRGKFDIYVPFWEQSLRVVGKSGRCGLITPSGFMQRDHGAALREFLARYRILRIHDFKHECVFEGATNYVCVTIISSTACVSDHKFALTLGHDLEATAVEAPQSRLKPSGWDLMALEPGALPELLDLPGVVPLGHVADVIAEGIVTGKNDVFLVSAHSEPGQAMMREGIAVPALRGECVDRYELGWDGTLLIYPYECGSGRTALLNEVELKERAPVTYRYLLSRKPELQGRAYFDRSSKAWFELWNQRDARHQRGPKLVIQENSVRCEVAFDDGSHVYLDTCCGIGVPSEAGLSVLYVLALLNSRLQDASFRLKTVPKAGGHFIHKPMFLEKMPIRLIEFNTSEASRRYKVEELMTEYETTVDRIRRRGTRAGDDFADLPSTVSEPRGSLHVPTDVIHDFLVLLARTMTDLNMRKQAEMRRFLRWLEEHLQIEPNEEGQSGIETLDGRTTLLSFLGDYQTGSAHVPFEDVWPVLLRNKRRLCESLGGRFERRLREEYEASLSRLLPIKRQLAATDRLIDHFVVQLYDHDGPSVNLGELEGG